MKEEPEVQSVKQEEEQLFPIPCPRAELVTGDGQIPSSSAGPGLNQDYNQMSEKPEVQSLKQVDELLPVMENTRRNPYDAAFKLNAIDLADKEGNRATARRLGVSESMIRRWRSQRQELTQCKRTTKAFRGQKSRWPELERELEDWVNIQRANGRRVSTIQIRQKAITIASQKQIENFRGGPSWCLRFMRRKSLFVGTKKPLSQQLLLDYQGTLAKFHTFVRTKMAENFIGPEDIINMIEVPVTFDLPLVGESSITVNTTGYEKTHFTCVLSCTASGKKLPPMVIFKRTTIPEEIFPKEIVVKVNEKGRMLESQVKEWLNECYSTRPGGLFFRIKALLVMDSSRTHTTPSGKAAIKTSSVPAVAPGGTTKYLQPLDMSVNRAFNAALRVEWETWMTNCEEPCTQTDPVRKATLSQVCQWILTAWRTVKVSTINNGFRMAGLQSDEESSTSSSENLPPDHSDSESEDDREMVDVWAKEFMRPDIGDNDEEEDFDSFIVQEGDEDSDQ